jgi:hypothetical protein
MDRVETAKILSVLKAAYPHSFKDLTKRDAESVLDLWAAMFSEEPYEAVSAAVYALIAVRKDGYSPTVGEVKERLDMLRSGDDLPEQSAWALVSKACRNGLYGYRKEFDRLPPDVQRAVGAPEQLRAWAQMDTQTVESVVASNFMRNYRTRQKREQENAKLPPQIRQLLGGITKDMKMLQEETP